MDRRQRKTREAILGAFTRLLSRKSFDKITVAEILAGADVGRATFYAHFETKDYLLKELCEELFGHIFDVDKGEKEGAHRVFSCDTDSGVFLHLFTHIGQDDNSLLKLLSNDNTGLFMSYFRTGVRGLVERRLADFSSKKPASVPDEFWINHITATCIETLQWWLSQDLKQTPKQVCEYFLAVI